MTQQRVSRPNGTGVVLEVRDLTIGHTGSPLLENVGFDISVGEMVCLIGPSGAGKTSLLLSLCGLLDPLAGSVSVEGRSVTSARPRERDRERRRSFGFVFQSGDLVPELTLVENVSLPLRLARVRPREALERARRELASLGIGDLARRLPPEVSVGQLQRAALARALVHRPPLILADEPTGALDGSNAELVFETLRDRARAAGAAVLVVTHDVVLAQRGDRILRFQGTALEEVAAGHTVTRRATNECQTG